MEYMNFITNKLNLIHNLKSGYFVDFGFSLILNNHILTAVYKCD